ncbi:MAG: beta-N-acetylhexosaminidase [Deltaproteobacteria bacterium]
MSICRGHSPFAPCLMAGLSSTVLDEGARRLILDDGIGAFILFGRNISNPQDLGLLCDSVRNTCNEAGLAPAIIAVDQEGGPVRRLRPPHWPDVASNADVARALDPCRAVLEQARAVAACLIPLGIHLDFAPVLDVSGFERKGVLDRRTYGPDPAHVARLGAIFIDTLQGLGVMATAKHFPGIGRVEEDPHHGRPVVRAAKKDLARDLLPFRAAIEAGVAAVMTSHVVYPALDDQYPATFSAVISRCILRDELGFSGVLVTDDLEMGGITRYGDIGSAAVRAFQAGHDLLLVCHREDRVRRVLDALEDARRMGEIPERRIEEALERLAVLRARIEAFTHVM